MRVLVTGNLGYNGVWVVKTLKEHGHEVVGLDTHYYQSCLFDIGDFLPHSQIVKDIREVSAADLKNVDAVVHLAGLSNDALGELDPVLTDEINYKATIKLAELSKAQGVKKFIFASSCSVYGIQDPSMAAREDSPLEPLTAYAKAKVHAEDFLKTINGDKFKVVIMRNATMHGVSTKLRLDLVINNLVAHALLFNKVKVLSDGSPWRPLLSIKDFARAVALFTERDAGEIIYNIGFNEENYQVKQLGEMVSLATGAPLEINLNKTPDERSYRVSFDKFQNEFPDFKSQCGVVESVKELIGAYKKYGLSEKDFTEDRFFRIRTLKNLLAGGNLTNDLKWQNK